MNLIFSHPFLISALAIFSSTKYCIALSLLLKSSFCFKKLSIKSYLLFFISHFILKFVNSSSLIFWGAKEKENNILSKISFDVLERFIFSSLLRLALSSSALVEDHILRLKSFSAGSYIPKTLLSSFFDKLSSILIF